MDLEEYVKMADTTASEISKNDEILWQRQTELAKWLDGNFSRFDTAVAGIAGEAGEVADLWKKLKFHNKELNDENREKMISELGDICWYLAQASIALGISFEDILIKNIEKLQKRHSNGFSPEYMKK